MEQRREFSRFSKQVIGCAIRVHKELGPGLFESIYARALAHELEKSDIPYEMEAQIPIRYDGIELGQAFRADFIVGEELILELKSVNRLERLHQAQILSYMRLAKLPFGLLMNFNVRVLPQGIRSFVL